MNIRFFTTSLVIVCLSLRAPHALALTMKQVSDTCNSFSGECSDLPVIQAYIGGALDMLATLDERTEYLEEVYCKEPKELFDVATIIRFMESQSEQYAKDNAMLVLVRYLEKHGGCSDE
jgi:hypothetical protein